MKTGKALVDRLVEMGETVKWRKFPLNSGKMPCPPFSTAVFRNVGRNTIASLMPLEKADENNDHFQIEVSETGIEICVFCQFEDAPEDAELSGA